MNKNNFTEFVNQSHKRNIVRRKNNIMKHSTLKEISDEIVRGGLRRRLGLKGIRQKSQKPRLVQS